MKHCISCQQSKIFRHTRAPFAEFRVPSERFAYIHIDLVGPLPLCKRSRYCLTVIDRYTRWPEVYPILDQPTETVAEQLTEQTIGV